MTALAALSLMIVSAPDVYGQAVEFTVRPAEGSSLAEEGGYFVLESEPGSRVRQAIFLRNDSQRSLDLELAAADARTGPYGGASYSLPEEERIATGAWITLEKRRVSLGAGASETVSFRVDVPADATSGEHLAGLVVAAVQEDGPDGEDRSAVGIDVRSRRVIAVQVNTPGPSEPELDIGGIDPAARPDGLYLEIAIENIGFGLTKGQGFVELPDEGFRREFDLDTFVPDTSIGYPVSWTEEPEEGEYRGLVEIVYDDGDKIAKWEGTFTVGDPVLEDLEDRGGAAVGGGLPWWIIAAAIAVLVLLVAAILWWRRRGTAHRVHLPPPATPRSTPTSSPEPRIWRESSPPPPPPPRSRPPNA